VRAGAGAADGMAAGAIRRQQQLPRPAGLVASCARTGPVTLMVIITTR
jgi:hypothetical protein